MEVDPWRKATWSGKLDNEWDLTGGVRVGGRERNREQTLIRRSGSSRKDWSTAA